MQANQLKFIIFFLTLNCYAQIDLQTQDQLKSLLNSKKIIVLNFHENWCPDSQRYCIPFNNLANKYSKQAIFIKINRSQFPKLRDKYGIRSVPTTIIFKNKKEIFRTTDITGSYVSDKLKSN